VVLVDVEYLKLFAISIITICLVIINKSILQEVEETTGIQIDKHQFSGLLHSIGK